MASFKPTGSTTIGVFLPYQSNASIGDVKPYWLAADGTLLRMTPQCKTALLASFEAVLERAVVPANVGDSVLSVQTLPTADFNTSTSGNFTIASLGQWQSGQYRSRIKDKLVRGCPQEDWKLFVRNTWNLWRAGTRRIQYKDNEFTFLGWQSDLLDINTYGWIEIDGMTDVWIPWIYDLKTAACDESYSMNQQQAYAPWGQYTGQEYPDGVVSQWAVNGFESLGCSAVTTGTPASFYFIGSEGIYNGGTSKVGLLSCGFLGNWTDGYEATSIRRSSSAWGVFQSMLANMKYSHILFSHSTDYLTVNQTRELSRAIYCDPNDLEFKIDEYADADYTNSYTTTNYLESGSSISHSGVGVAAGFKFVIPKGQVEEDLALAAYPIGGLVDIDGRDYAVSLEDQVGGLNTVYMNRWSTSSVISSSCSVKDEYPATAFRQYGSCQGVGFIDGKFDGDAMYQNQTSAYAGFTESGSSSLLQSVQSHASRLINELTPARTFAQPAPIDTGVIRQASNIWWSSWKLVYPNQPNWPADNPQKYFPVQLQSPTGERRYWVDDTSIDSWVCDRHGGVFGSFEMAYPDYPFGWTNEQRCYIQQYGEAVAGYIWDFKAMHA